MVCPSWMLGVIEGNAAGVKGWDIANTFPGGGGNWGGSFLTVPTQGKNQDAAKKLADWLTAPEQQIKAFKAKGTFPSQVRGPGEHRAHGHDERLLHRRADRPDLQRAGQGRDRRPVQGPEVLRASTTRCSRRSRGSTSTRPTTPSRPGRSSSPRSKPSAERGAGPALEVLSRAPAPTLPVTKETTMSQTTTDVRAPATVRGASGWPGSTCGSRPTCTSRPSSSSSPCSASSR